MKIGILGIGGVGGYFGGLLAKRFGQSETHEIIFIAREATKSVFDARGLTLKTTDGDFVVNPSRTESGPNSVGILDVLIVATKSYDLEEAVAPFVQCITSETLILPLLNGVSARPRLEKLFPQAQICDGCVYIVSYVESRGIIVEKGGVQKLSFGSTKPLNFDLDSLQTLFLEAGITSLLTQEIDKVIWEKYVFISAVASLTSVTDMTLGAILESPVHRGKMEALLQEVIAVGKESGVKLSETLVQKSIQSMERLPHDTTSSMQRDFRDSKKTEVDNLTGYVSQQGKILGVDTPIFDEIYASLKG